MAEVRGEVDDDDRIFYWLFSPYFSDAQLPANVREWTSGHVWSWLQQQPFASELKQEDWRFVSGGTLQGYAQADHNALLPLVEGNGVLASSVWAAIVNLVRPPGAKKCPARLLLSLPLIS